MKKPQFLALILLLNLAIASGPIIIHTDAAPPSPRPVLDSTEGKESSPVLLSEEGQDGGTAIPPESNADTVTLPPDVPTDWWTAVQEDIRRSEYHVTWQEQAYLSDVSAAYQAPNRAHNLRTYFTSEGPVVIPRVWSEGVDVPPWRFGSRLVAWGREGALQPVSDAVLHTDANRIKYHRDRLTEWYVNSKHGLEQGFTIWSSLLPRSSAPLLLELTLTGDLVPNPADDNQVIELTAPDSEPVLRYADLRATDATGRELPAQFAVRNSQLTILVDDNNATYPITVDPTIAGLSTTVDWTAESDQEDASFGYSVGTAGDVNGDGYSDVIVGAPYYDAGQIDEGRAYGYHGSAMGLKATPNWIAESDQGGGRFGYSVSGAGDVNGDGYADVIVGSPRYNVDQTDEGKAYVYLGSTAGLLWTASWEAEGDQEDTFFGYSVSTAGDVNGDSCADVIVGDDDGQVHVYRGTATGVSTSESWSMGGKSVSTAGDVNGDGYSDIIIGGWSSFGGRAYVYHGSATGLNTASNWMVEGSASDHNSFGCSVGTAGDVNGDGYSDVIVGADDASDGQSREGRAYVYYGSTTGLSTNPAWAAEGDQIDAHFGNSVSTAGDINGDGYADVIVGSVCGGSASNGGQVSVYLGSVQGLSESVYWRVESDQSYAHLGRSVDTAGDVNGDGYSDVIVGADGYSNGQTGEGRAFVYHGAFLGLSASTGWTTNGDRGGAELGTSVDTAGDVNGDGYADVIVGVPGYDGGQTDEGRAYAYHGTPAGLNTTADWTAESNQADAYFGHSVGMAGDVNGDGYTDIIVGAYGEDRAYVYQGGSTGLTTDPPDWMVESDQDGAYFGYSVCTAGDVNGDGYADVIVGAHRYDVTGTLTLTDTGRVYVYQGGAAGLSTSVNRMIEGDQASANLGYSVGTAGDVNGDGYTDVIVGAPHYGDGQDDEGQAYVYHGSKAGLSTSVNWTGESDQANAQFGTSVSTAGDVNGDGYADVIVGAPYYDGGQDDEGQVYVHHGSKAGLSTGVNWTGESDQADAQFGTSVSTAGDVNGDGYADVIVGAPLYAEFGIVHRGGAFAYHGSVMGLSASPDWTSISNQTDAQAGASVSTAGDVNADGCADVIVGVPYYDGDEVDEGQANVYYGNGGNGLALTPRQMRTDGSVTIAPLGMSDLPTMVQLRLNGRMPLGRERVKLHWQVAPLGTPFTATTEVIAGESVTWTDVLTTGVVVTQSVTGLMPETPYHWRARLLYRPGNRMGQSASRWVHIPWNSWTEQDFRTSEHQRMTELSAANDSPTSIGSATTLTATATLTNPAHAIYVTYTWDFGDGSTLLTTSDAVVTHTYPALGVYTAVVTASNPINVLTATTRITVVDAPITGLAATNDSPTALGQATTLSATIAAGSNVSYTWDLGDGHFAGGSIVTHTYPLGIHSAVVTATNSVSSVTATTTIIVDRVIDGLSAVNDSPTQLNDATILTATVTAGSNVSYTWRFGDGDTASGAIMTHTYSDVGVYTAMVTAANSVSVATATTTVTINAPITGLTATNDSPTPLGQATTLTAIVAAGGDISYMWNLGDGRVGIGAVVSHTYPAVGTYTAVVSASNSVNVVTASTTVNIMATVYLPLVMKRWPPVPYTPVLNPIDNTDQDGYYTITWGEADLADSYILEEATNASFSGAQVVYQGTDLSWTVPDPGKMPGTYYYRVKARNSWGDSSWSNIRSVIVTHADLIVNGGFESGPPADPWVQDSSSGLEMIDELGARTGDWGVYMGGLTSAVDQIYQEVTIPSAVASSQLSYWRLIRTADSTQTAYDEMRCVIWDTSGNVLAFCGEFSNVDQSQGWIHETYDMSAFRGQTVNIGFKAFNDEWDPTQFFIDDVSLLVSTSGAAEKSETDPVPQDSWWHLEDSLQAIEEEARSRLQSRFEPNSR